MTRRVRSGSSQKHKKMPGNATKWGEFDNQQMTEIPSQKKKKDIQKSESSKLKSPPSKSLNKISELKNISIDETHSNVSYKNNEINSDCFSINQSVNPKLKKKFKKQKNFDVKFSSMDEETDKFDSEQKHKKIKLEDDCSIVKQNDFEMNKNEAESFTQHKKKKKSKKVKQNNNDIDSKNVTIKDVTAETSLCDYTTFDNNNEISTIKQDVKCISSSDKTRIPDELFPQNNEINSDRFSINQPVNPKLKKKFKKQKNFDVKFSSIDEETDKFDSEQKHKKIKLESNCSTVMQNAESSLYIKQNDFEMNKNEAESLTQHKKKKKSKKVKQNNNDIDSKNITIKDVTAETSLCDNTTFDSNNEISTIKQDIKCIDSSDKTHIPDKSLPQNMVNSPQKETFAKHYKIKNDPNHPSRNNESYKKKVAEDRKSKYLEKLQKKREELGLLLLPRNVECKLHKIKRRITEKGFPPEMQKEIMRKARRKEELKFRKIYNPSKVCFNCREPGHVLADCPKKSESFKQETGICFKCGSVEHVSYKCPEKVQGFPFAKCFICKEQGHISRECMKNKHGIYPKGGRCKLCGNVNHLKKDCPTLQKTEIEEENITLPTLNEDASIDAEVMQRDETEKKPEKKAKIVKF